MLRTWACLSRSGRNWSTTSITLPNMAVRMAWRSFSFGAHAHISSSDFGGRADVEPADGPGRGLGPGRDLGHAQHGVEAQCARSRWSSSRSGSL